MDRQSLLEQKRRRLEELKARRLSPNVVADRHSEIDELVHRMQVAPKKMVSIGVQTDAYEKVIHRDEVREEHDSLLPAKIGKIMFDKGVQAVPLELDVDVKERLTGRAQLQENVAPTKQQQEAETSALAHVQEEINLDDLNTQVTKTLKTLNKLLVQESHERDYFSVSYGQEKDSGVHGVQSVSAFIHSSTISGLAHRPVRAMDVCRSQAKLIAVAYGVSQDSDSGDGRVGSSIDTSEDVSGALDRVKNSPGCAVVYNHGTRNHFPEFYLLSTSPISKIKFDKGQPNKVIGGLANGRVVVWELQKNGHSVVLLPLLISPILSTSSNSLLRKGPDLTVFKNHVGAISLIAQDTNDSGLHSSNIPVITASLDGIINLWSTSILASPKVDSVELYKPLADEPQPTSTSAKDRLLITSLILLASSHAHQLSNASDTPHLGLSNGTSANEVSEEHEFLNNAIVACQDGNLYKLCNKVKANHFIEASSKLTGAEDHSMITSVTELFAGKLHYTKNTNNNYKNQSILVSTGMETGFKVWHLTDKSIDRIAFVHTNYTVVDAKSRPDKSFQFVTLGFVPSASSSSHINPVIQFWNLQKQLMSPILTIDVPKSHLELVPTAVEFSDSADLLYVGFSDGNVLVWSIDDLLLEDVPVNSKIDDGIGKLLDK